MTHTDTFSISSSFDGGNIHVLNASDPQDIQLEIRKDNQSDFYQWFSFRVTAQAGTQLTCRIMNAGGAAYPKGFEDYDVCVSEDGETWLRSPVDLDGGVLTIPLEMETGLLHVAYFAPYDWARHQWLVANCAASGMCQPRVLGQTLDGRDMDCLVFDDAGPDAPSIWLIGRQHPGETMAEWWMEGALETLCDPEDPIGAGLRRAARIHVVPNMNPDGSVRGHLRTNAAGVNLNRVWDNPTMEREPEVKLVRDMMDKTGVDICLDVHGDEALPYNFIAGFEGVPSATAERLQGLKDFKALLSSLTPDFQTKVGYPAAPAGRANLSMATNQIAERYGALSMTLEMPFKDTVETPVPETGWSPARCAHLGRACLQAIWMTLK